MESRCASCKQAQQAQQAQQARPKPRKPAPGSGPEFFSHCLERASSVLLVPGNSPTAYFAARSFQKAETFPPNFGSPPNQINTVESWSSVKRLSS